MRSLTDMTPEERLAEFAKTEWSLVTIQGFKLGSDEPLEEHVTMAGNIDFTVMCWIENHGWDPKRTTVTNIEFMGVLQ